MGSGKTIFMEKNNKSPFIIVLGIAQDAGVPQSGCNKSCCKSAWDDLSLRKFPTSLGIVDPETNQRWLIDITPDFKFQFNILNKVSLTRNQSQILDGIFFTHGHIGHFTGLILFEKAAMNTNNIQVFAMPKMKKLLTDNFPWKSLVHHKNIKINTLTHRIEVKLNKRLSLLPFLVPHRSEYSETVGYIIKGSNKKILFIPDIDDWELFDKIDKIIKNVDVAFFDGTFFDANELPGRDITKVPHPFICDSIKRFSKLPLEGRKKIYFIHLNHTNQALNKFSKEYKLIIENGYNVAQEKMIINI